MLFVTLLPLAIFIALVGLEVAVCLIQAYVFNIVPCTAHFRSNILVEQLKYKAAAG